MTIKLIQTDSEFLEMTATKISTRGEDWYYQPFWYKKVAEGLFEQVNYENLPDHVKQHILYYRDKIIQP